MNKAKTNRGRLFPLQSFLILFSLSCSSPLLAYEIVPGSTIYDTSTTIIGVNHIGLSVRDLDAALEFYQAASGFELIRRETVKENSVADNLYGRENVEYEVAVLEAPNMLFELREFSHNRNIPLSKMPVFGPGMTHTCFQTPSNRSGVDRFKAVGAEMLTRGGDAIDLGGYGVTYAYAYDPDGNMFELEQLDEGPISEVANKVKWIGEGKDMWMTQVALVTHDIDRLTDFYAEILAIPPYREGDYVNNPRINEIADIDELSLRATWFRMNARSKTLEFWEYRDPATPTHIGNRDAADLGYSYSIEVGDIQQEYTRMAELGVHFVSEPVLLGDFWQVNANDIDGNSFSLRQVVNPASPYSVPQLEQ
jgi:catechol 2,3-dioxygenase-like lactoylglutathione lyase family enzyme